MQIKRKYKALDLLHEVLEDITALPLASIPSETDLINTMLSMALDLNLSSEYARLNAHLQDKESGIGYYELAVHMNRQWPSSLIMCIVTNLNTYSFYQEDSTVIDIVLSNAFNGPKHSASPPFE